MYLKEVQGFRVVAALLVAIYHIWFHRVSGGVDAFFVIAGFFMVQNVFLKDTPDWKGIIRYWRHTIARIIPSASVVMVATGVIFYLTEIDMLWRSRILSGIAALLFTENWWLALTEVDYLSVNQTPTPFQQMWALSVQMQLYIGLPAILFLSLRATSGILKRSLATLFIAAFLYALYETHRDQPFAYFNTAARAWEFLAGGILAVLLPQIAMSKRSAKTLGYISLLVLVGFAAVVPVATSFPGVAALVPVLATCGVIIAAKNHGNISLLTSQPMQWLGNLSFTFYLWHWPLYILVWDLTGKPTLNALHGIAVIGAALLLSVLTYYLVEQPFRKSAFVKGRLNIALATSAAIMAPAVIIIAGWGSLYLSAANHAKQQKQAVLAGLEAAELVPATIIARFDNPVSYSDGCYQKSSSSSELIECTYGNPKGTRTIALVGGSHSLQWLPALRHIAQNTSDLRILNMAKSGCTLTLSLEAITVDADESACLEWSHRAVERLLKLRPDAIVTTATRVTEAGEIIPKGYRKAWNALRGIPILAIRDNPRANFNIAACVDRLGPKAPNCTLPRSVLDLSPIDPTALGQGITLADFTDHLCEKDICPPTRGNLLIYRDSDHLTSTYVQLLAPYLKDALATLP